jgi:acetyltransferase
MQRVDRFQIRPLRLQDAAALRAFLERLSPASRYDRFQYVLKEVTLQLLQFLLVADPRSHVALGAFDGEELVGEARYASESQRGEFAIVVADGWRRRGLGRQLLDQLVRQALHQGLHGLDGEVLAGNTAMIAFVTQAGFSLGPHPGDGRLVLATQELGPNGQMGTDLIFLI